MHAKPQLNVTCIYDLNFLEMVEPGQDLLLAALSESGISPNDLFDIDSPDVVLANPAPTPAVQQVKTRTLLFARGHKSLYLMYWERREGPQQMFKECGIFINLLLHSAEIGK